MEACELRKVRRNLGDHMREIWVDKIYYFHRWIVKVDKYSKNEEPNALIEDSQDGKLVTVPYYKIYFINDNKE